MNDEHGGGWVYVTAPDIVEAELCMCDLCGRVVAEGVLSREEIPLPHTHAEFMTDVMQDYKRRRRHWWGRAQLWILRHTT